MRRLPQMFGTLLLLSACGAPTKSASQVSDLFTGDSVTLQEKETKLCNALATRSQAPTTQGLTINLDGCQNAGLAAIDFKSASKFYFTGLDGAVPDKNTTQVIHKAARGQVWLNRSLLGLASTLGKVLQSKKDAGSNTGIINLPNSGGAGGGLAGLVTPKIEMLEEPQLDPQNLEFSAKIHLTITGAIAADHVIEVNGKLIDNAFGVTIKTSQDQVFEKSLLQNFQAVVVIIPHAGDVYMDLFIDMNIFNIGLETLFSDQVDQFLSTGLKTMIDSIMQL